MNTKIYAIVSQKGGVSKTTTTLNLGIGLARQGKKVLLVDADSQGNLTDSLGWSDVKSIKNNLATELYAQLNNQPTDPNSTILHHAEGIDLIPSNMELVATEAFITNAISREFVLKKYLRQYQGQYDYILIDCMPSLSMMTLNALVAADSLIIPVQTHYLPAKGMTLLLETISVIKEQANPNLNIDGILFTMTDSRTNLSKEICAVLRQNYGEDIRIFNTDIPFSVKAPESSANGMSIYKYAPNSKIAQAYESFTMEVLSNGK